MAKPKHAAVLVEDEPAADVVLLNHEPPVKSLEGSFAELERFAKGMEKSGNRFLYARVYPTLMAVAQAKHAARSALAEGPLPEDVKDLFTALAERL